MIKSLLSTACVLLINLSTACYPPGGPTPVNSGSPIPICIEVNGISRSAYNVVVDKMTSISLGGN